MDSLPRWELLPYTILRQTGFPFELQNMVRLGRSRAAIDVLLEHEAAAERERAKSLAEVDRLLAEAGSRAFDPTLHAMYLARRSLQENRPDRLPDDAALSTWPDVARRLRNWQTLMEQAARCHEQAHAEFAVEWLAARHQLRALASDERFQTAIFLSSPSSWEALNRLLEHPLSAARPRRERDGEQLAVAYLQRFTSKNDTTSFFGPSAWGRVDPAAPASLTVRPSKSRIGIACSRVRFPHWACQAVVDAAFESSAATRQAVPLGPDPLTSAESLVAGLTPNPTVRKAQALLARVRELQVQFSLASLATRREVLNELEARFEDLTAVAARRGAGRLYANRSLLYELCQADYQELTIGGELAQVLLDRVPLVLERFRHFYRAIYDLHCRLGHYRELYECLADEHSGPPSLADLFQGVAARAEDLHARFAEPDFEVQARDLWQRVVVRGEQVPVAHELPLSPFFSPDVMVAGSSLEAINRGEYLLVVGENHPALTLLFQTFWNWCPWPEEVIGRVNAALASSPPLLYPVDQVPERFVWPPQAQIRHLHHTARSLGGNGAPLGLADIPVVLENDEVRLAGLARGAYVEYVYNELLARVLPLGTFKCFEFMVDEQGHTPRIVMDKLVTQRATWRLTAASWREAVEVERRCGETGVFGLFVAAQRIRRRLQAPERVFAKATQEYKPFLVDFACPFTIEVLDRAMARSQEAVLTEMLPDRECLWLEDIAGHYTCELRLAYHYRD